MAQHVSALLADISSQAEQKVLISGSRFVSKHLFRYVNYCPQYFLDIIYQL